MRGTVTGSQGVPHNSAPVREPQPALSVSPGVLREDPYAPGFTGPQSPGLLCCVCEDEQGQVAEKPVIVTLVTAPPGALVESGAWHAALEFRW